MTYRSVDELQNVLAERVFAYATDRKKAAGRALGTLVEIVTFYLLRAWGLRDHTTIERSIPEYGNPGITHNVEFCLHGISRSEKLVVPGPVKLPLSLARLRTHLSRFWPALADDAKSSAQIVTSNRLLRNSCTFAESETSILTAHLDELNSSRATLTLLALHRKPFALFECKRVGVEEGTRKGPQTIEKAKQGAYVARAVSSLQKVRLADGRLGGLILADGDSYEVDEHPTMLERVLSSDDPAVLREFVLTVGVVSNHGNWFTSNDLNKEMKVLAQSYDWLLFLTDAGLAEFIRALLLEPSQELAAARTAFLASYGPHATENRFTKVSIDLEADDALQLFFRRHLGEATTWFNVISPAGHSLIDLQEQIRGLASKPWDAIHMEAQE